MTNIAMLKELIVNNFANRIDIIGTRLVINNDIEITVHDDIVELLYKDKRHIIQQNTNTINILLKDIINIIANGSIENEILF